LTHSTRFWAVSLAHASGFPPDLQGSDPLTVHLSYTNSSNPSSVLCLFWLRISNSARLFSRPHRARTKTRFLPIGHRGSRLVPKLVPDRLAQTIIRWHVAPSSARILPDIRDEMGRIVTARTPVCALLNRYRVVKLYRGFESLRLRQQSVNRAKP
jgi:hypothetical protein